MAVMYYSQGPGQLLAIGLSTDTKPAPEDGYIFVESDTGKIFRGTGTAWESVTDLTYAGLDAGKVLTIQLGGTGADPTKFLRGDRTWAMPVTGSANIKQTEVDFGAMPVAEGSFIITDADVSATSQIICIVAYEAPTGKDLDELEMDRLDLKPEPGSGQFVLHVSAVDGSYLHDKFRINYLVG